MSALAGVAGAAAWGEKATYNALVENRVVVAAAAMAVEVVEVVVVSPDYGDSWGPFLRDSPSGVFATPLSHPYSSILVVHEKFAIHSPFRSMM